MLPVSIVDRNHVTVSGQARPLMLFSHGFGCDQSMWRAVARRFEDRARVVLFDHVGAGQSLSEAYDPVRHGKLAGYADDVIDIVEAVGGGPVIFIGHSVSATIGVLAARARPDLFKTLVLVCASPRYIDDADYRGGFAPRDIEDLLDLMDKNTADWTALVAPKVAGPSAVNVQADWSGSVCRMDPAIARAFARVTFLSDHRADYAALEVPALLIDTEDDALAPESVGVWMAEHIPHNRRVVLPLQGHCPHMTDPDLTAAAIAAVIEDGRVRQAA